MVDFTKRLKKGDIEVRTNPIEIYEKLDRKSVAGPLRPAQSEILSTWFNDYVNKRDVIVKLHTGEGKTLIGLLILQSKLNSDRKPCIFVCPNIYLVEQVVSEAKKFGIPYCIIGKDKELPNDFLDGKKILITHVQKLFNGKSKFGLDNNYVQIGSIILDDSHACIDSIKNSFTINIERDHKLFNVFLSIFEDDLKEQGEGTLIDIKNNHFDSLLAIPYWSWIDHKSEITRLLSEEKEDSAIAFTWPIIKDSVEKCQAFITSSKIEISPTSIPVPLFKSFAKADQRILMSATTQDDAFFIKGFGFDKEAVQNPLANLAQKWSGEKMILIPSLIDESFDTDFVIRSFGTSKIRTFGVVSLVPSFRKSENYKHQGAKVADSKTIFAEIENLKREQFDGALVIVNRYDGIDLPDSACRILIIDSMPYFDSLYDLYEEQCRLNSDVLNVKFAQKIEQGLGRSVRGEKDYSVIILTGSDLVKFVKSSKTVRYFSQQTQKQIDIGLQIAEMAKEDLAPGEEKSKVVSSLINQCLRRDTGWKTYYEEEMGQISDSPNKASIYDILQIEKEAEDAASLSNYEGACAHLQKIADKLVSEDTERGWYTQLLARYKYFISKTESNKIQKSAFQLNNQLLKPKDGISYKQISYINQNRIGRIRKWIAASESYNDLILNLDSILSDFSFGVKADKFENALKNIGELLGFESQRPDKEFKKGPDNLWCGVENRYFLFECKSEVDQNREEISKYEAGQMNSHCAWFDTIYGPDSKVKRILIIPTKKLSYYGDLSHEIFVMRKSKLTALKSNIKSFFKEFKPYVLGEIQDEKIQEFINEHNLDIRSLENEYCENVKLTKSQNN